MMLGLWFFAALAIFESNAVAQTPQTASLAVVNVNAAGLCPDTRTVARRVEERLGREAFVAPTRAELFVEARLLERDQKIVAEIRAIDADGVSLGVRELNHDGLDCSTLTEALSLVVSLIIDPEAQLRDEASSLQIDGTEGLQSTSHFARDASPTLTPAPPVEANSPTLTSVPTSRPRRSIREIASDLRVNVGGIVALGIIPPALIGVSLRASVRPNHFVPLLIGLTWLAPGHEDLLDTPRATYQAFWGELGICPLELTFGVLRFDACGSLQLGSMLAALSGASEENLARSLLLVALAADTGLTLKVGRFLMGVRAGLAVPLRRYDFAVLTTPPSEVAGASMFPVTGLFSLSLGTSTF